MSKLTRIKRPDLICVSVIFYFYFSIYYAISEGTYRMSKNSVSGVVLTVMKVLLLLFFQSSINIGINTLMMRPPYEQKYFFRL